MDDIQSSIPSNQQQITSADIGNVVGAGSVGPISATTTDSGVSTLSPSQQSEEDAKKVLIAGIPVLPPPLINFTTYQDFQNHGVQGLSLSSQVSLDQSDIITDMLNKWSENIEQIKEQIKEEDNKKIMEGTDPASMTRMNVISQENRLASGGIVDASTAYQSLPASARLDLVSDIISSYKTATAEQGVPITPAIATGLVFSSIGILQAPMASSDVAGVTSIQNAFNSLPSQMFSGDMRAELGLLGTFMLTGITRYTALGDSEVQGAQKGAPLSTQERAENFAQAVVSNINASDFNVLLNKIITSKVGAASPLADQMVHIFKLRVLSVALAALYKTEGMYKVESNITPHEFVAMLNGTISFSGEEDIRNQIIGQIKTELDAIPDLNTRQNEMIAVLTYLNSNPSVADLVQGGIFAALSDTAGAPISG